MSGLTDGKRIDPDSNYRCERQSTNRRKNISLDQIVLNIIRSVKLIPKQLSFLFNVFYYTVL